MCIAPSSFSSLFRNQARHGIIDHIWIISNFSCKSSMAWLIVQTIFGESSICFLRLQEYKILKIVI